jgi:hypothetical protein
MRQIRAPLYSITTNQAAAWRLIADGSAGSTIQSPFPAAASSSTLKDAGTYITKLPKAEHEAPEWQAAMQAMILVATKGAPTMLARIGIMESLEPSRRAGVWSTAQGPSLGAPQAQDGPMTVFVYINTAKEVDYVKVFSNQEAAERWFEENDLEDVAFEYDVLEWTASAGATLLGGRREVGNQVAVTRDQQAEQDSDDQGAPNEGFPPAY